MILICQAHRNIVRKRMLQTHQEKPGQLLKANLGFTHVPHLVQRQNLQVLSQQNKEPKIEATFLRRLPPHLFCSLVLRLY